MFQWLRRFWTPTTPAAQLQTAPDTLDLWEPQQREIYHYFDGQKVRNADPMPLFRRMKDVSTDLEIEFKVARSGMKGADEHYQKAVQRIRGIFDVKPLEEGGLTEIECVELFTHFWNYSGGVKKNLPPPSTPSPGTSDDTPPSTGPAPVPASPTPPSSDSGSTAAAATTGPPAASPSA